MSSILEALEKAFTKDTYKLVLSAPVRKDDGRLTFTRKEKGFQLEKRVGAQAFHENLSGEETLNRLNTLLGMAYRQYNGWDGEHEYMVRVSKKGEAFYTKKAAVSAPKKIEAHDREKEYILKEGKPIAPLVKMGVFTQEGRIVKAMYDKYRQVNRFLEIIDDALKAHDKSEPLYVIDFGCGKSYLTFVLYHYLTEIMGFEAHVTGLDLKSDVIESCNRAAGEFGYESLRFQTGDIAGFTPDAPVSMVVSLHACDTATDYALFNAISWGARYIFSVPCCQHELNAHLKSEALSLLTRYGVIKERAAALMTDAIRANLLTFCGYKTQVLEFVDLSHTPKNLLLRAQKAELSEKARAKALSEVEALMETFCLNPTLYALLKKAFIK